MKKLLALLVVCVLASVANAGLVIVDNLDGTFGIASSTSFSVPTDNTSYMAVSNTTFPTGGTITAAAPADAYIYDDAAGAGAPVDDGFNGVWGDISDIHTTKVYAAGTYINNIQAAVGVTVSLYTLDLDWNPTFVESVTLTPEPMTMGLLGLGGLFLRRRSK
jgi:hypothetical protein